MERKGKRGLPVARQLKKTPENLRLQASLKAAHPRSGQGSWISVKKRGRKRRRTQVIKLLCVLRVADLNCKKDEGNRELDNIRVNVPSSLKHKLVQDRDAITMSSQVSSRPPCSSFAQLQLMSHSSCPSQASEQFSTSSTPSVTLFYPQNHRSTRSFHFLLPHVG